ncbi:MAG: hypothetical protein QG629_323 [Patescibacteria group bacterium]|nr:hypothetical protein [Patescibacteria group bacterium]
MFRRIKVARTRATNGLFALLFLTAYTIGVVSPFIATKTASAATIGSCTKDQQGADDQPGQKDLTMFCPYTDDQAGQLTVGWAWDETAFSGNNSGDACALFDTDADGKANYAVCVTIKGSPAAQVTGSPFVYSCDDSSSYNCVSATTVVNTSTTCMLSASINPFSSINTDTYVLCTVVLSDVGGSLAALKDVCSYPSSSRPSSPSDCVITPTGNTPSATVNAVKSLLPATDTGTFVMAVGSTSSIAGGDGTQTGPVNVTPPNSGTLDVTVSETAGPGTDLASYTTNISCKKGIQEVASATDVTGTTRSIVVAVANGDAVVCTFTNTRKTASVTVLKDVRNDNGGTLTAANFSVSKDANATSAPFVATTGDDGKYVFTGLPIGATYTFTEPEANSRGYSTDESNCANLTVTENGNTCTIVNDDVAPGLKVVKSIVNDNNGKATVGAFAITANGSTLSFGAGVATTDTTTTYTATPTVFANASYDLAEGTVTGYTNGTWACTDDMTQATVSEPVRLALGQHVTCTITNDDQPGTLTIRKVLNQPWGGTKKYSDFHFLVNGQNSTAFEDDGTNVLSVNAGKYSIIEAEANQDRYTTTYSNCTDVDVANGENETCTITNIDSPASIKGTKFIVNSNLGLADDQSGAADWVIQLQQLNTATNVWGDIATALTDVDGNFEFPNLVAGTYRVFETITGKVFGAWTQLFGNTESSAPSTIALAMGDVVGNHDDGMDSAFDFGNFKNNAISGSKWNDLDGNGKWNPLTEIGLAGWTIQLKNAAGTVLASAVTGSDGSYTIVNVAPGNYQVCEEMQTGWAQTHPGTSTAPACHAVTVDTSGQSVDGQNFGNIDTGKLTVVKIVNNAGTNLTKGAEDFQMNVSGNMPSEATFSGSTLGTTVSLKAGTYSVTETPDAAYAVTYSADCNGTMEPAVSKTCTVTNTAIQHPGIVVVKSGPEAAHEGDTVTYTYEATNTGNVPFTSGSVIDMFDGDVTEYYPQYVSGDENDNDVLDPGETFTFNLEYVIPEGQDDDVINTMEVCGYYQANTGDTEAEQKLCDTDDHTLDILHPALQVVKSGPVNIQNGEVATYTFTVTNTGDTPLKVGSVIDDVAGLGLYQSGDTNGDGMLDMKETWVYTASKRMTTDGRVTNTVEVCATDDLEIDVCAADSHTTIVYTPQVLSVAVTKTTPQLQDTGSAIVAPSIAALLTFSAALLAFFDKQRNAIVRTAKRNLTQPFILP